MFSNVYLGEEFSLNNLSTIGVEKKEKQLKMKNGEEIKLVIFDTAGQERFHSIASNTLRTADGVCIFFEIIVKSSFKEAIFWYKEVRESYSIPIVLVACKCDVFEDEREVTKEEAENFAKK